MDIRDSEFGFNTLKYLNKQLISGFELEGTTVDILDFSDNEAAMSYSMSNSGQLPVEAFISTNQDTEQTFNADYHLIIVHFYWVRSIRTK